MKRALVIAWLVVWASRASADEIGSTVLEALPPDGVADGVADGDEEVAAGGGAVAEDAPAEGATAIVAGPPAADGRDDAETRVRSFELAEMQPRSAPDALRFVPGVSVQQSAHGQASPYVRGMTGQQVVHEFDGIRLNNGIYRQGPNQYFVTVDVRTVDSLEVVRGGSSVRHGADALGGAILATPRDATPHGDGWFVRPRLTLRGATADRETGGRFELGVTRGRRIRLLVGGGYRDVNLLRAGGVVSHRERPAACDDPSSTGLLAHGDCAPWSPRFVEEQAYPDPRDRAHWRTQLGTGYREATADARLVAQLPGALELTIASYAFAQFDAPRTDQCPPQETPISECLRIELEGRFLSYARLARNGRGAFAHWDLTLLHQRHHERRRRDRPLSYVRFDFEDIVDTGGIVFRAETRTYALGRATARANVGAEVYLDGVESTASQTLTDLGYTSVSSRGQYVTDSSYLQSGMFAEALVERGRWTADAGVRFGLIHAASPADPASGTAAVRRLDPVVVGRASVHRRGDHTTFSANVDQSFRAANLDDLTSRQSSGPGFQFENDALVPERGTTFELGVSTASRYVDWVAFAYATLVTDAIARVPRTEADCPPMTPACNASRNQYQLVNLPGLARVVGAEGAITLHLPRNVTFRSTVSFARGDAPSPVRPAGPTEPMSRVPPPMGTFELRVRTDVGLVVGSALRWAAPQERLSLTDTTDVRIPRGGTPGYAVWDLRLTYRLAPFVEVNVVAENLLDAGYRVHGSSVLGPARGVVASVSISR